MKVELRAKAVACLEITRQDVADLKLASERHYDMRCKAASMRVPEVTENGMIAIWDMFFPETDDTYEVDMTFDQLDLLGKITETFVTNQHGEANERIMIWHFRILRIMRFCNDVQREWVKKVEV